MATIKGYTDLEQSKVLAEMLPLETADMYYCYGMDIHTKVWSFDDVPTIIDNSNQIDVDFDIPCWSLAALIEIIENIDKLQKVEVSFTHNGGKYWIDVHFDEFGSFCQDHELYDSKIDALIAMIENFKNRNLL